MGVVDRVLSAGRALKPPKHGDDPTYWRWAMILALTATILTLSFHITASKGYLEEYGVSGFPSEEQFVSVDTKVNAVLEAIYGPQIRDAVRERCNAPSGSPERERAIQELERLLDAFRAAAGYAFPRTYNCGNV